jgi:hypothetical protein
MYGDDSENDAEDILGPIIEEFSIKEDVNLKNFKIVQASNTATSLKNKKKAGN